MQAIIRAEMHKGLIRILPGCLGVKKIQPTQNGRLRLKSRGYTLHTILASCARQLCAFDIETAFRQGLTPQEKKQFQDSAA